MLPKRMQHWRITGALAGTLALTVVLAGCGGGDDTQQASSGQQGQQTSAGTSSGGTSSGGDMMSGGGPGMMASGGGMGGGQAMGGPGGGAPGAGGQQMAAVPPKDTTLPRSRPDPFRPWWNNQVPPPPVTSFLVPVRVATNDLNIYNPEPGVEIQEVPNRRIAGILTGNGVSALLDDPNDPGRVVKPGDVLPDGYRVVSTNADSVTLKKQVGSRTYTQVVPLTDAGSSVSQFSGPTGAGGPGGPGFGPGGPGFGPRGGFGPGGRPGGGGGGID